ncbi:Sin3 associated polypeptide p18-domain-containing protein [Cokeromyces recurvatus]|uniref:Sin3 associated polypeptide p18-domain-containing protein n=1 Tax=Cokeromyces recurvatus TaxID=90255 RepID=UPI002220C866|nr:Sin3 associated polypeptide p18-domain-containing protein [Cokeromyces recurvatus]KAI7908282.1 Sin3 associated polypeptide p18-domain-containing protein [Cokeromyces recurvatus]
MSSSTTTVDREKECPFLLRIFFRNGGHNPLSQYTIESVPSDELSLYTWKNATLEEIAQLIEQVVPEARDPDARIAFRLIYLDSERARYNSRELGRVVPANPTEDQKKTLEACNFFIGDYLDVAIFIGPPANIRNKLVGRDAGRARTGDRFGGRLGNDRFSSGRNFGGSAYNRDNNSRYGGRLGGRRDRY